MSQIIKSILVKDLVLWTENPRDPILSSASNEDIINHALADTQNKWQLEKLAKEMGGYYDYSELPIVVYKEGIPVVYDGNRRVILAKLKLHEVKVPDVKFQLPDVDNNIPCNVCSEQIALQSVYRKHVVSRNTWNTLERDMFMAYQMHLPKSTFLMLEESTKGYISKNTALNQGFVRDEIFTDANLKSLGVIFDHGQMLSCHSIEELKIILEDIALKILTKKITTRFHRGKPLAVLDQRTKEILDKNKGNEFQQITDFDIQEPMSLEKTDKKKRKTRITHKDIPLFGDILVLKSGDVNNLYSDLQCLYSVVKSSPTEYSTNIYAIFRMGMRLLCETAMREESMDDVQKYINKYFSVAKKTLSKDFQTLLSNQNVSQSSLAQLLHTGAHNYFSSSSQEQLLAISIILGAMLLQSHGKN